jgi:purine-binding chemotaxis protein CheW
MSARDGGNGADPARARRILEERARALARPVASDGRAADALEVLVFSVSGETHAIEARLVREVARFTDFTAVPGAPAFLVGVTNLRGDILPVFDLAKLTGIAARGLGDLSRLIVLGEERDDFGVLADEVREVKMLRRDEVLDPPEALAALGRDVLLGVTRDGTMVLDGEGLLRDPRLFIRPAEAAGTSVRNGSDE